MCQYGIHENFITLWPQIYKNFLEIKDRCFSVLFSLDLVLFPLNSLGHGLRFFIQLRNLPIKPSHHKKEKRKKKKKRQFSYWKHPYLRYFSFVVTFHSQLLLENLSLNLFSLFFNFQFKYLPYKCTVCGFRQSRHDELDDEKTSLKTALNLALQFATLLICPGTAIEQSG